MHCPDPLPGDVTDHIRRFAAAWAASPDRPDRARRGWTELLEAWIIDPAVPLLVRRVGAGRGQVIPHWTGRDLVPTDNSPAHWALSLALQGIVPTLPEVRDWFAQDCIPVAMVLKKAEREKARYRCTRSAVSLNDLGWKVAHLDDVRLGRGTLAQMPLEGLRAHCRRFLNPGNMFLVPLPWAGLAEVAQVVSAIRSVDAT